MKFKVGEFTIPKIKWTRENLINIKNSQQMWCTKFDT